jgi:Family of unknown function (DUF6452)
MKKPGSFIVALFIGLGSGVMISCAPEACFEETNAYLKATFYSNTTKDKHTPDSLTLIGLNKTNKIYNKESGVQPALFPLDASSESCTFIIKINNVTDTIQFIYSSYPHLISKECGYTFYHKLDTFYLSRNAFYVYKSSNNITTANEENIRIFY